MAETLEAGRLDRRITLEKPTRGDDGLTSEGATAWGSIATVWAEKQDVRDGEMREQQLAGELRATITLRFRIRWSEQVREVDPTWRVRFEGRLFNIERVKEIGRRVGLELSCSGRNEA